MPFQAPEAPVIPGNARPYPKGGSFAKLLDWHLDFGTRPKDSPARAGLRWDNKKFAKAVGFDRASSERSIRNWRAGREKPSKLVDIEEVLFGDNDAYAEWRLDLRAAYDAPDRGVAVDGPDMPLKGRDEDVRGLAAQVKPGAAVLVQGPPGIGKTQLTRAVAGAPEVAARFGEGRAWFVALQAAGSAAELEVALAAAVGVTAGRPFAATCEHLKRLPGLVVLDNLETPCGAEREATGRRLAALAAIPGVGVLASFRGAAFVEGPGWAYVHPVGRLEPPFDAQLFAAYAGRDFSGDPHFAGLLAALGGVPLALRLVGRRAYGRANLNALWAEWEKRGAGAAFEAGREMDRLGSLAWSFEISLSAASPGAQRLFRLLGALPAGLAEADREAVFGEGVFDAEEGLLSLGLAFERDGRLDMLAPIRKYARVSRRPEGEDADRWRRHYLKLAREIGEALGTKAGFGGMARLWPEFANMSAALAACLPDRVEEAAAAVHEFGRFAYLGARPAPILAKVATECGRSGDVLGQAHCIRTLGNIALARSQQDEARKAYEQAIPLYRDVGDLLGEANCIQRVGDIALQRSQYDEARKAYEQAIPLHCAVGDVLGAANCILNLGDISLAWSQHDKALEKYEMAIRPYRDIGSVLGEANCIYRIGEIGLRRLQHDEARQAFEEAIPLYRSVGDVLGEANSIRCLGDIALRCSQHQDARKAYEQAILLYRNVGDILGEANCIRCVGEIALARSQYEEARKAFEQALPMFRLVGNLRGEGNCWGGLGDLARAQGDLQAARAYYETALELYRRFGDPVSVALAEARLSALAS